MAPHPETVDVVGKWLALHGLAEENITQSSADDWVTIRVPVGLAEEMLTTHPLGSDSEMGQLHCDDVPMDLEDSNFQNEFDQEPAPPRRRIPRAFNDIKYLPEDLNICDNVNLPTLPARSRIKHVLLILRDTLQTTFDSVGFCRLYPRRPSFEPNKYIPSSSLAGLCPTVEGTDSSPKVFLPPYPFPNMSIYRIISWMNLGPHQKSKAEIQRLVKDVLQADDFDIKHLEGFSVRRSLRELDKPEDQNGEKVTFPDGWIETNITISIPMKSAVEGSKAYTVPGFHYRPLVEVIRSAFADVQASAFHLFPFKQLWKDPLDGHQERIIDKLYTSNAWLKAQDNVQKLPKEPGCSLECVIAGLMLFSDATHLANFGTAKAWPLYLYFRNLMKYM
ncbi:hypothetical protein EV702DRAFT_1279228 [Suillus placidus]|uniref:Peptidase S53 activation domain-containing protein n=1 Tax=Suillus placidus TaxID=48579 RepID=A0A9P7D298_9AGAM|nr:hypothetical protein EV702DRAFT_1279228 [Suillus placidus]